MHCLSTLVHGNSHHLVELSIMSCGNTTVGPLVAKFVQLNPKYVKHNYSQLQHCLDIIIVGSQLDSRLYDISLDMHLRSTCQGLYPQNWLTQGILRSQESA